MKTYPLMRARLMHAIGFGTLAVGVSCGGSTASSNQAGTMASTTSGTDGTNVGTTTGTNTTTSNSNGSTTGTDFTTSTSGPNPPCYQATDYIDGGVWVSDPDAGPVGNGTTGGGIPIMAGPWKPADGGSACTLGSSFVPLLYPTVYPSGNFPPAPDPGRPSPFVLSGSCACEPCDNLDSGNPAPSCSNASALVLPACTQVYTDTTMVRTGDLCCYPIYSSLCNGRPYVVAGEARQARKASRSDWGHQARPATAALIDPAAALRPLVRAGLSREWLADALAEHASIASFARFTLDLLAVGAPPELIVDSQLASLDEVEHARLCFALAERYGARPVGPDMMPIDAALRHVSLTELAVAVVCEGCVGETIASLIAAEQHRVATDPRVRAATARIADDEARHAELAWRTVRWAIEKGGEPVKRAAERAFRTALAAHDAKRESSKSVSDDALTAVTLNVHGRLTSAQQREVIDAAILDVVTPCMLALSSTEWTAARSV